MIEKSNLDTMKENLISAKANLEKTLHGLKLKKVAMKSEAGLREINKTIKAVEKSLKMFQDL